MKKYLLFLVPLFFIGVFLIGALPTQAQYGLGETADKAGYKKGETPTSIATTGINAALSLTFLLFLILAIYSGIRWMTARGKEEHVTKAKDILEAAIIGLVVISLAYGITNFVLEKVKGASTPGAGNSGTTTLADCTKAEDEGAECGNGDNMACHDGSCVTACQFTYPDDGACVSPASSCDTDGGRNVVTLHLCPGSTDNVCCHKP